MSDSIEPTGLSPEYSKSEANTPSQKSIEPLIYEQSISVADKLKEAREKKILTFAPDQKNYVLEVQEQINFMRSLYEEYVKNPAIEKREGIQNAYIKLLTTLEKKESNLQKNDIPVGEPSYDPPSMRKFRIFEEHISNTVINRFAYKNEILNTIATNRQFLLDKFDIPLEVELGIKFLTGETHNGGRKTVLIGYLDKLNKMRMFVYKPRDAKVDKAVIDTFHNINNLPSEQKSSQALLPNYKIINFPGDNASIWEYIPGDNLARKNKLPESAGSFIAKHGNEDLKIKLVRLDDILSLMNISDIHGENVIIKKDNSKNIIDIVPVDLENVYINPTNKKYTGLVASDIRQKLIENGKWKPLSSQEEGHIHSFMQNSKNLLVRYIPLGTTALAGLITSIETADNFIYMLLNSLTQDRIEFTGNKETLKEQFLFDLLQGDVPFFTEINHIIYYGIPNRNIEIGKRS